MLNMRKNCIGFYSIHGLTREDISWIYHEDSPLQPRPSKLSEWGNTIIYPLLIETLELLPGSESSWTNDQLFRKSDRSFRKPRCSLPITSSNCVISVTRDECSSAWESPAPTLTALFEYCLWLSWVQPRSERLKGQTSVKEKKVKGHVCTSSVSFLVFNRSHFFLGLK